MSTCVLFLNSLSKQILEGHADRLGLDSEGTKDVLVLRLAQYFFSNRSSLLDIFKDFKYECKANLAAEELALQEFLSLRAVTPPVLLTSADLVDLIKSMSFSDNNFFKEASQLSNVWNGESREIMHILHFFEALDLLVERYAPRMITICACLLRVFKGHVLDWFQVYRETFIDYVDFRNKCKAYFLPKDTQMVLKKNLLSMHQGDDESFDRFRLRLVNLNRYLQPRMSQEDILALAVQHCLPRYVLQMELLQSLEEETVLRVASAVEKQVERESIAENKNIRKLSSIANSDPPLSKTLNVVSSKMNTRTFSRGKEVRSGMHSSTQVKKCFGCAGTGHLVANCPKRKKSSSIELRCFRCGRPGVKVTNCSTCAGSKN